MKMDEGQFKEFQCRLLNNGYELREGVSKDHLTFEKDFIYPGKIYEGTCKVSFHVRDWRAFPKRSGYTCKALAMVSVKRLYRYKVDFTFEENVDMKFVEDTLKGFLETKPKEDD